MTSEKALSIIHRYLGNIGNNPAVRKNFEDCANALASSLTIKTELSIVMTVHMYLRNPHKRKDLDEAREKIIKDVFKEWDD